MIADLHELVLEAESRIRPHVRETILDRSAYYSDLTNADVYFKLENLQYTGSFKVRGALNKILALDSDASARGVVAASTGNHGAAVAYSLSRLGAHGIVFVPEEAAASKVRSIEMMGIIPKRVGRDPADTEAHARRYAEENGMTYVSPYNDELVVAGQGTIGVELERQLDGFDVLIASLGGGGLISGIAGYLASASPGIEVIASSPENSQVMIRSIEEGEILDLESAPTLSDGTAGGVEPGAITFDTCRELIDRSVTVTEEEIKSALRGMIDNQHMLVEGAAGVAVACCEKLREHLSGRRVVVVICGGNIGADVLKGVLAE